MKKYCNILTIATTILGVVFVSIYGLVSTTKEFEDARNWLDGYFNINLPISRLLTIIISFILIYIILRIILYFANKKSLKLASIYISSGLKGVVSDKLTNIKDFKSQLDVISSRLTKTEINQLINYYSIISELEDIQNDYKNLIENFFNDHPTLKKDSINFINIKGKNSRDKLFYELMQKLFNANIADLMNALGKI